MLKKGKRMKKIPRKYVIILAAILLLFTNILVESSIADIKKTAMSQSNQEWSITQYSSKTGNQAMFYTIKDNNGTLTVVDGGYQEDAKDVKEILKQEGSVVDNWIITHPHPDHVGAFNDIAKNDTDEITIKNVYTIELDYDKYKEKVRKWDNFDSYQSFLSVIKDWKNVIYVHDGDEFNLNGLKMKVLNAYSEETDKLSKDLANDGSMMFKLTGKEESMLFCADVGCKISDKIMATYKEELPSDYVQMGHHGNGGLTDEFYACVKPKVAFFDAPEWLMENINPKNKKAGKWKTPQKIALMEGMGAKIYGYPTAPNHITLH